MAKRGNKEGSIYKRTDGRWCAQLTIGFQNGKQQKKYLYGKSRTEVRQKLLDFQSNKINLKQDKVEAFLLAWLRFLEPQIVESTFIGREHKIKAHIIPQIGHLKLNAVTVQHVSDMQLEINDNAGPTTAARCVKILRQAFKHAMISELLTKNVAELVP